MNYILIINIILVIEAIFLIAFKPFVAQININTLDKYQKEFDYQMQCLPKNHLLLPNQELSLKKMNTEDIREFYKNKSSINFMKCPFCDHVNLIRLTNVCFDYEQMILYVNSENIPILKYTEYGPNLQFDSSKKLKNSQKYYENKYIVQNQHIYITVKTFEKHITHFIEIYNFLLHYIHHLNYYEPMQFLLAPGFDKNNEYEWNRDYYNILIQSFPKYLHIRDYTNEYFKMNKISIMCFKDVTIIGKVTNNHQNGANFAILSESYYLRALVYKRYHLELYNYSVKTMNDLHIKFNMRTNGRLTINKKARHLMNFQEIKSFLKLHQENIVYINFETMSFKEQIETMVDTDILILVDGGAITNLIFMLPYSGVLDLLVPLHVSTRFQQLAQISDIYHFYITETNYTLMSPECKQKYNNNFLPELIESICLWDIHMARKIYIDKVQILLHLIRLKDTILNKKYFDFY
ncbi:hypothetical protein WA158_000330 [Blastocystis sp. Blastoise]